MPYILNLKELRLSLKLSQAQLARMAKVDRDPIYRCENGHSILELSCEKIKAALEEEAKRQGKQLDPIVISPGGINGDVPKKSQ
jgi:predicted transcriptional regulator